MPEQHRLDQRHGVVCTTDPFHTVIPAYFTVHCVTCSVCAVRCMMILSKYHINSFIMRHYYIVYIMFNVLCSVVIFLSNSHFRIYRVRN